MAEGKDMLEEYPLTQDFVDFNRLNLQHHLWKDIFGYSLHPKIPRDQQRLKIADVGTGTGIWLLDVARDLDSSAELVGLDLNIAQAGPREWLPSNVSMAAWDAFTAVPDELVGQFDIVNLRLFGFVIRDDARPVLRNLIKMLKPGGYVQWCEADVESWHLETVAADVPTDDLVALWRQAVPQGSRLLPSWVKGLPDAFVDEGLLGVEADWQAGKPHTTLAMHWCNLHLYQMIAVKLRRTNPEKAAEIDALLQRALVQSHGGAVFAFDRVIVIGQKKGNLVGIHR